MIHLMILLKLKKIFSINIPKWYSLFLLSSRTCDILTVSYELVKFWSILTGKVRIVYENLMENGEITCFYFDKDMKRLFLDDGRIKKFKLSKGTFIKEFSQHNKDVVIIMFLIKLNMIVSISS